MSWPRRCARPLVLGHRGASRAFTENTIRAFLRAIDEGADGVELDVRLSADGVPVVFHDDTLQRLAGLPARVDEMESSTLAEVELEGGERIPTLHAVFEQVHGWINVEIKPPPRFQVSKWCRAISRVIEDSGATERVLVTSFHPGVVAWFRLFRSRLDVGLLFHAQQGRPLRRGWPAALLRVAAVHPQHILVGERDVLEWRRHGWAIGAWTVDDPRRARRLAELGVTAIITNVPGEIVSALQ